MKEKFIDKIRKLLALSKSSNQHEAELALRKANELMQEHQIKHQDLVAPSDITHTDWMDITGQHYIWAKNLASSVASVFDCKIIIYPSTKTFRFVGDHGNLEATQAMFWHLFKAWKDMCKTDYQNDQPSNRGKYRKSHGLGFATAIGIKARQLVESRKEVVKKSTGTDLVVINTAKVTEYMDTEFNLHDVKSRSLSITSSGYSKGRQAGDKMNLSQPLKGSSKNSIARS